MHKSLQGRIRTTARRCELASAEHCRVAPCNVDAAQKASHAALHGPSHNALFGSDVCGTAATTFSDAPMQMKCAVLTSCPAAASSQPAPPTTRSFGKPHSSEGAAQHDA